MKRILAFTLAAVLLLAACPMWAQQQHFPDNESLVLGNSGDACIVRTAATTLSVTNCGTGRIGGLLWIGAGTIGVTFFRFWATSSDFFSTFLIEADHPPRHSRA